MRGVLVRILNFSILLEIRRYTAKLQAKLKLFAMAQKIQHHAQSGLIAYGKQSQQKSNMEFGGVSHTENATPLYVNGKNNTKVKSVLKITFLR